QQDEFPILEYQAPKAFFIGHEAGKLHFFDERTAQFTIADKLRIATLRALPEGALQEVFKYYRSSNPDIRLYMAGLLSKDSGGMQQVDPTGHIIFRPAHEYPENPPQLANASPEYATCLKAEARILRD